MLLTTKLYIPPSRPGLVVRSRLLERLETVRSTNLILVSAPAGFGKTTLLSEWVHQIQPPVPAAWLSLDTGENDPIRFWDYFIAALKTLKPDIGETALSLLHSPQPMPIETVLTSLINDLTTIKGDFILVLDDYHIIQAQPVHEGVTFVLDHLPPRMHLVIATREDPALPLARLRVKGAMMEIGSDDLRFTEEEAAGLFKQPQGGGLSGEDILALNTRAEGWVAGLKMAALSLREGRDIKNFVDTFTGSQRHVMDYLLEEVLHLQSEEVQQFLLQTSILERLTAPLCDYVTGRTGSREMLARLDSALGGFLVPLDESRQWYRYHHLFAELLRHQLEVMSGAEKAAALHQRASQWYEDRGLSDDAIHHALAAQDWQRAMTFIYAQSEQLTKTAEWNTLLNWLHLIPDESLRTHPKLYSQYASALIDAGQFDPAEDALRYLEQAYQDDNNLQGEIAGLRARIAEKRGDYPHVVELSKRALSLLAPDNLSARSRASSMQGFILFERGLLEEAEPLLTEAYEGALQSGNQRIACMSANFLASITWLRGKLRRADDLWRKAIALAEHSPSSIAPRISLGTCILYEWNDLEAAVQQLQRAIELSQLSGDLEGVAYGNFVLAPISLSLGDTAGAVSAMKKADRLVYSPGVARYSRARHAAFRVWFAIRQDDSDAIAHWGNKLSEYAEYAAVPGWLCYMPSRVLIACGKKEAAAEQLKALHEKAAQAGLQSILITTLICQALAAATPAEALNFLSEALTLGQPEGFIRTFVDEGRLLAPLLRKALSQGITPEYARMLLKVIEAEERRRSGTKDEKRLVSPESGLVSQRELEVLRLVAEGLSNQQIADKLTVSLSTAKSHVYHLFDKLDAKDRMQVVIRARELKLI